MLAKFVRSLFCCHVDNNCVFIVFVYRFKLPYNIQNILEGKIDVITIKKLFKFYEIQLLWILVDVFSANHLFITIRSISVIRSILLWSYKYCSSKQSSAYFIRQESISCTNTHLYINFNITTSTNPLSQYLYFIHVHKCNVICTT